MPERDLIAKKIGNLLLKILGDLTGAGDGVIGRRNRALGCGRETGFADNGAIGIGNYDADRGLGWGGVSRSGIGFGDGLLLGRAFAARIRRLGLAALEPGRGFVFLLAGKHSRTRDE